MTDWQIVRAAVGVVQGQPADAVEDAAALHDEDDSVCTCGFCYWCERRFCEEHGLPIEPEPVRTPAASVPVSLFPEVLVCSFTTRFGPGAWRG